MLTDFAAYFSNFVVPACTHFRWMGIRRTKQKSLPKDITYDSQWKFNSRPLYHESIILTIQTLYFV